jgi:hypothetical protein
MRKEDLVNPKRWFAFVQAYLLKWLVPYHIAEQIIYRSLICNDCMRDGKCKHCGCHTPVLFYSYFLSCEEGKWGPFFNRKNWKEYKRLMNIDIKL